MRAAMERTNFATLMLYAALASALLGYSGGAPSQQPMSRPFPPPLSLQLNCAPQFALVNQACSMIMPMPVPPPTPPSPPLAPPGPPCPDDEGQHGHGHHHHHHHDCHKHHHKHGDHHRHGHHHRHRGEPSPVEQDCCRWLKELDSKCVCDLLVHLPSFLARPIHDYTVIVGDSCKVTYSCGGRLHP